MGVFQWTIWQKQTILDMENNEESNKTVITAAFSLIW